MNIAEKIDFYFLNSIESILFHLLINRCSQVIPSILVSLQSFTSCICFCFFI